MKVNLIDQALIACTDDMCQKNVRSIDISTFNSELIMQKFKQNNISVEKLLPLVTSFNQEETRKAIADQASKDRSNRERWIQLLKFVSNLLRTHAIQHVFIKALKYPYAIMGDLDILTLNYSEELKALEILHKVGFAIFKLRILLDHPLKLMALKPIQNSIPMTPLDFYPDLFTNRRKKVCDSVITISRKKLSNIGDVEVFVPSPEDDLYLIGTHAYGHLRFTLAEILHGLEVLCNSKSFDWEYLFNLAQSYGTQDAVYLYMKILEEYSKAFRPYSCINGDFLNICEKSKICRKIRSWFKKKCLNVIDFPVRIPSRIGCVYSSIHHCKIMWGRMPFPDILYDFLTHYLTLFSMAIWGEM